MQIINYKFYRNRPLEDNALNWFSSVGEAILQIIQQMELSICETREEGNKHTHSEQNCMKKTP